MAKGDKVVIESPYEGSDEEVKRNMRYARACVRDCLFEGEMPFASHLLYTQPGILDDNVPEERRLGIEAGLNLSEDADITVVYCNFGITPGMQEGIKRARKLGRRVIYRALTDDWEEVYETLCESHSHKEIWGV